MYRSPSVTLVSRTIINTPYQKRLSQVNYETHKKRLQQIKKPLAIKKIKEPSHIKLLHNLQKYRQASKSLINTRHQKIRQRQNSIILNKLNKIYNSNKDKTLKTISKSTRLSPIRVGGNAKQLNKKREQQILEDNLVLIQHLKQQSKTPRQMRMSIKNQINEYLSKRARLRKNVLPQEKKKHKKQLSLSRNTSRSNTLKSEISIRSIKCYN